MRSRSIVMVLLGLSLGVAGPVKAQGNSAEARLRGLNGQAVSLLARYQRGDAGERSQARAEAARLLAERRAALDALIAANPKDALRLAFAQDLLGEMSAAFPDAAMNLEARGRWQGTLELIIQDGVDLTSSKEFFRIHSGGRAMEVVSTGRATGDFKCNDTVAAAGVRSGDKIVAGELNLVAAANAVCSTTGAQSIAVIKVNMPGYAVSDPTDTELHGIFLGNAASGESASPDRHISDFWFQNSDGKTWVNNSGAGALTVVNVTLDQNYAYCICDANGCSDNSATLRRAVYTAADPVLNYADYSRVVMIFPNNGTCSGIAGVGTIGCWGSENPGDGQSMISWTWWRADQSSSRTNGVKLGTHEMGHNLTMSHSGSRDHGAEVIGPIGSAGTRTEYGDSFGTMGSWNFGFYNAHHSVSRTGWMNASNYTDVSAGGTYSIAPFDAQGNAVKALRVKRGTMATNAWFWIAYYPSSGIYLADLADNIHGGAVIHGQDGATPSGKTDLLDFTPATTSWTDPALTVGQCWQDPYTDLQICATSISGGMLNVTVNYSLPPCTNADPAVSFHADDLARTTEAGSAAQFRVLLTNNDSLTCAARTFSMSSAAPGGAGWTTSFSSNPSLAPGASATMTLTKTPASSVAPGTYDVSATASSPFNSGTSGTSTASANPLAALTVTEPPPQPPAAPSGVTGSVALTGAGKNKTFQSYTVRWTDNSGNETDFELRRCKVSGKGRTASCAYDGWSATGTANATSYTSTTKPASGTYRFEVRARNSVGNSAWAVSGNVSIP